MTSKEYKVIFQPFGTSIKINEGDTIIRAAMDAGVHVNASCGGEGVCGKCRVIVEDGSVEGGLSEKLSAEDQAKGYRLACQAEIRSDVVVRVPVESAVDASVLNKMSTPRKTAHIHEYDFEELKEQCLFLAPVEKEFLELPQPTPQDNLPDITRLISYLNLQHDEHRMEVDLSVIRKIPDVIRENDFKMTATLVRPVREDGKTRIINVHPAR